MFEVLFVIKCISSVLLKQHLHGSKSTKEQLFFQWATPTSLAVFCQSIFLNRVLVLASVEG